jgi:hypothetical protein
MFLFVFVCTLLFFAEMCVIENHDWMRVCGKISQIFREIWYDLLFLFCFSSGRRISKVGRRELDQVAARFIPK